MQNIYKSAFLWSDESEGLGSKLFGYAISADALVIDCAGLSVYLKNHSPREAVNSLRDGKFAMIGVDSEHVYLSSDFFGLEPIYYWSDESAWVASNSVFVLLKELRRRSQKLVLRRSAIAAFQLSGAFGTQLMSCSTWVEGVKILPVKCYLQIDRVTKIARLLPHCKPTESRATREQYHSAIQTFISSAQARMLAVSKATTGQRFVDLSGGQDSRLVYGLAASTPQLNRIFFARSNPNMSKDFEVASKVSSHFSIKLGSPHREDSRIDGVTAFELWKIHNAGVYRPVYPPLTQSPRNLLQFNGASPIATGYVKLSANERLKSWRAGLAPEIYDLVHREFRKGLSDVGLKIGDDGSIDAHYANFRSRLHYGRASYTHLVWFNDSPLMSSQFAELADLALRLGVRKNQLMCDLLVSLHPTLAQEKFASDESNFSNGEIAEATSSLPRLEHRSIKDLTIYGEIFRASVINAQPKRTFQEVFREEFMRNSVKGNSLFSPRYLKAAADQIQNTEDARDWGNASVLLSYSKYLEVIRG